MNIKNFKKKGFVHVETLSTNYNRYVFRLCEKECSSKKDEFEAFAVKHFKPLDFNNVLETISDFIKEYDKSEYIQYTSIGNDKTWFDKCKRFELIESLKIQENAGIEKTIIYYIVEGKEKNIEVNVSAFLKYLYALELYAVKTYQTTKKHLEDIKKLKTIDELLSFDITKDYPAYVIFKL